MKYGYGGGDYVGITNTETVYFDTKLENIIQRLGELTAKYSPTYTDLHFETVRDCGCHSNDCGCTPSFYLCGQRDELPLEREFRVAKEKAAAEARDARERAEFERLKAQFESTTK